MTRHQSTTHLLDLFEYGHLPANLQAVSKPCADLALQLAELLKDGPELTVALRKLLEAKDAFVRQAVIDLRKHENHVHTQVSGPPLSAKLGDSPESDVKPQESAEKPQVALAGIPILGPALEGLIESFFESLKPPEEVDYFAHTPPESKTHEPVKQPSNQAGGSWSDEKPVAQCRCPKNLGGKHHPASHSRGALSVNEIRAHEGLPPAEPHCQRC